MPHASTARQGRSRPILLTSEPPPVPEPSWYAAATDPRLRGMEAVKDVLAVIARHVPPSGLCYLSDARIGELSGRGRTTIRRAVELLESLGYIRAERGTHRGEATAYRLDGGPLSAEKGPAITVPFRRPEGSTTADPFGSGMGSTITDPFGEERGPSVAKGVHDCGPPLNSPENLIQSPPYIPPAPAGSGAGEGSETAPPAAAAPDPDSPEHRAVRELADRLSAGTLGRWASDALTCGFPAEHVRALIERKLVGCRSLPRVELLNSILRRWARGEGDDIPGRESSAGVGSGRRDPGVPDRVALSARPEGVFRSARLHGPAAAGVDR